MKKFFRMLLLIIAIVPCAIFFAGCGADGYDRAKSEASFKSAVGKLQNLGDNYTTETTKTATGMFADGDASAMDALTDSEITKFDGGKTIVLDGTDVESYTENGLLYEFVGDTVVVSVEENAMFDPSMLSDEVLEEIFEIAFETNSEAVKVDGSRVEVSFSLAKRVNDLLKVVENTAKSQNNSVAALINNIFDLYDVELPVVGTPIAGQGQIENFIDGVADMTFDQIFAEVKEEAGFDVVAVLKASLQDINLMVVDMMPDMWYPVEGTGIEMTGSFITEDLLDQVFDMTISQLADYIMSMIGETEVVEGQAIAMIKSMLTEQSVAELIATIAEVDAEMIDVVLKGLTEFVGINTLDFKFAITTEGNNVSKIELIADVNVTVQGEEKSGLATIETVFSDFGTTEITTPSISSDDIVSFNTVLEIHEDMIKEDGSLEFVVNDTLIKTLIEDGLTVYAESYPLISLTENEGVYTMTIDSMIVDELFAEGSQITFIRATAWENNTEATIVFAVVPAPVVA